MKQSITFEGLVALMEAGARNHDAVHAINWLRDLLRDMDADEALALLVDAKSRLEARE